MKINPQKLSKTTQILKTKNLLLLISSVRIIRCSFHQNHNKILIIDIINF